MNWLKRAFGSALAFLKLYFKSGRAAADAKWALEHAQEALVYVDLVMPVLVGLTPTNVDDAVWTLIRTKYPQFFDGSLKTPEELKTAAFVAAGELFAARAGIDTSRARAAVQLAYLDHRAQPAG